ncbi:MAG: hypothetical protein ACRD0K_00140 [Egibacteraceae bacterium]
MTPADIDIEVVTPEELHQAIENALAELGMTFEELRREAECGEFSSERAWLTWFMIAPNRAQGR